jgi:hypothetical protein
VSTGRWRHDQWLDATHDKRQVVTIIGNKTSVLLHSVLKEIHECTAVGERGSEMAHLGDPVAASSVRDHPLIGGSCLFSKGRVGVGDPVKSIPEPGTERTIVDCAADLEQQISAVS